MDPSGNMKTQYTLQNRGSLLVAQQTALGAPTLTGISPITGKSMEYTATGQQQTVYYTTPAPSTRTAKSRDESSPGRLGIAEEAKMKVCNMQEEMRMVESTIESLQRTNSALKNKMLSDRRSTLEKYFMSNDHLIKQAVVGEWKRYIQIVRRQRDLEGIDAARVKEKKDYQHRIAQLENANRELMEKNKELNGEIEKLHRRQAEAEAVIHNCGEQLGRFPLPQQNRTVPSHDASDYVKTKLHDILREVDPRYIPPLNGPSVHEISIQEQLAYQQGRVMHAQMPLLPNQGIAPASSQPSGRISYNQLSQHPNGSISNLQAGMGAMSNSHDNNFVPKVVSTTVMSSVSSPGEARITPSIPTSASGNHIQALNAHQRAQLILNQGSNQGHVTSIKTLP